MKIMSKPAINRRRLGVTFTADLQANVVVWIPQANQVALSINNHALILPLQKDGNGYWRLTTNALKPGDTYTFVLDNEKECADPASLLQPEGVYGSSQAFDTSAFYWEDSSWVNPPIDEYIVYELDIPDFTSDGTLKAVIWKLRHLKKLGINAILLRPVTDFPEARSGNTEAAFLFAVQAAYGGPGQLQQLVNACHFEGMAVMLDVAYKQTMPGRRSSRQPVSRKQENRLDSNVSSEAYRHYIIENALMWFRDFHVDALRLKNVSSQSDAERLLWKMREATNSLTAQTGRQHYLLVEQDSSPVSIDFIEGNELQHSDCQATSKDNCNTYYMNLTGKSHQTKQYRKDCLCDGRFSKILQDLFEHKFEAPPEEALVSGLQTYHQPYEQSDEPINSELLKLIAGSMMVSPCIPTLFMGEEWGVTSPFRRVGHHESVRTDSEYELNLLVDSGNSVSSGLPWELLNELPNQTLYRYYQSLTDLRRNQPALHHLNPKQANVIYQDGEPTLLLHRSYNTNQIVCLMNFSHEKQSVTLPDLGKNWQKLLDSADPVWNGPGSAPESLTNASTCMLQPESIVVYIAQS
ncbi:malto-oligosyltrehalose trehalohydrolase [Spirosoma daeguense]